MWHSLFKIKETHLLAAYLIVGYVLPASIPSQTTCLLQSFVSGDLYEFYVFHLYFEQILVDEDQVETRLRFHRTMSTPLLPRPVFIENRKSNDEAI